MNLPYKKILMAEVLKPVGGERFAIRHITLTQKSIEWAQLRDRINGRRENDGQEPGTFAQLIGKRGKNFRGTENEEIIMSDTWMEWNTNWRFLFNAHGRVLIAGLGLGMILLAVQDSEEIEHITVLEKEEEVIALVKPQLPLLPKVEIIHADAFEWKAPKGAKFDTIYFDIWPDICGDNYEGMKRLHRRFARSLNRENPKAFMDSWRREEIRYRLRQEARQERMWR